MGIKLEIFAGAVSDAINTAINYIDIDVNEAVNTRAFSALSEIRDIIQNENIEDDFYVVEEIIRVFEKYNIDPGFRHDF